jgi:multicomponent K+:H+ antiporter subunit E
MTQPKHPSTTAAAPGPRRDPARPKGWLAHPALSVLLATVWLLLQESLAPAQILAAIVFGLLVPRLVHGFLGPAMGTRRMSLALRFVGIVLWDIVVSNLTVARIVLSPGSRPRPAWVRVPLRLQQPGAITLLATIITTTPGTVSCIVDDQTHEILVHALDCSDPQAMAMQIQERYEQPLMEIFG